MYFVFSKAVILQLYSIYYVLLTCFFTLDGQKVYFSNPHLEIINNNIQVFSFKNVKVWN